MRLLAKVVRRLHAGSESTIIFEQLSQLCRAEQGNSHGAPKALAGRFVCGACDS